MKGQNSTNPFSWTNVLSNGAFLRWQGKWWVWGSVKQQINPQNNKDFSIYSPHFFDLHTGFFKAELQGLYEKKEMLSFLHEFRNSGESALEQGLAWEGPQKQSFQKSFASIQNAIQGGSLKKAVPLVSSQARSQFKKEDLVYLWKNLLEAPEHLIPYAVWTEEGGFLGATPELLYFQENQNLKTMALAGTWPKNLKRPLQEFLDHPKENQEHDWVVQDLLEKLQSWGRLQQGPKKVLELPHLYHLQTEFELLLSQKFDMVQFVKSAHPTSALGVYPRSFPYQWMKDLPEQESRGVFGAPICFQLGAEESIGLVAIRGLEWKNGPGTVTLRAGCGLVEQSELESEWNELNQKLESIRKLLKI